MKLYRITLKGMRSGMGKSYVYGEPYVVAESMDDAYQIVKNYLALKNLGFQKDRELHSIELLAEQADYPDCGYQLFIARK